MIVFLHSTVIEFENIVFRFCFTKKSDKNGKKNWSNVAAKWGENYIHWKKFEDLNPLKTRSDAEMLEKELAIKFSKKRKYIFYML